MEKHITGIMRARAYAPGSGYERDHATFRAVAEALNRRGWTVDTLAEEDFCASTPVALGFSLVRSPRSIELMERLEAGGSRFVNSAAALRSALRSRSVRLMQEAAIPMPRTTILSLRDEAEEWGGELPVWVKRGDGCTQAEGDISLCHTAEEVSRALDTLRQGGAEEAVLSQHAEGWLVKFYGVTGTPFFAAFAHGEPCLVDGLENVARRAACCHGLEVWGGDCIVTAEGTPQIIDFNDWPSFAACRTEAAEAIAGRIDTLSQ